jgi:uncharacterized protein
MTPGIRSGVKLAASYILASLAVFNAHSANSQSFDCRKASTAVERAICTDKRLKRLDSEMAKNYQAAKKQVVPEGLKALVTTQRQSLMRQLIMCIVSPEITCRIRRVVDDTKDFRSGLKRDRFSRSKVSSL